MMDSIYDIHHFIVMLLYPRLLILVSALSFVGVLPSILY